MDRTDNPTPLRIVAGLFIFSGICAIIEIVVGLLHSHVDLNFGVLCLWIGPGLLRHNRTWRTWALVFLWFGLILLPVFCLFALGRGALDLKFFGVIVGKVSPLLGIAFAVPLYCLILWQYRVLTRPDIRALFQRNSEQVGGANSGSAAASPE